MPWWYITPKPSILSCSGSKMHRVSGMLHCVGTEKPTILHVCSRDVILDLRTRVLSLQGFEVVSTSSVDEAYSLYRKQPFSLLLIDVEGDGRVPEAEELCHEVKKEKPDQKVAFVCNFRVSLESSCPDEIIRSDFNPAALVRGVENLIR